MIITVTLNASIDRTAVIKNFSVGKINRLDEPIELAGGKGLNVTRALHTLGYKKNVTATGFIGGKTGEKFQELMDKESIKHDFFKIAGNTRYCMAIIDNEKKTLTELNENGPFISLEELDSFFKKLEKLSLNAKILTVSGSLPKSLPDDTYAKVIEIAKNNGLITMLDARDEVLKKGIGVKPYIIKPNRVEAEGLLGFKLETQDDLIKGIYFLSDYCEIACITLEHDGCIIGNKKEVYQAIPPEIHVINTVGSGDSFLAGLIHGFINNFNLENMAKVAIATGTANAMTDRAGLCYLKDIKDVTEKVKVIKLL